MRFPIASWNLVLESCVSTTFKPYKRRFIHSCMKVVRQSLPPLFIITFWYMRFPIASWNLVLESCVSTTFKPYNRRFIHSCMKVVRQSLPPLFTIMFCYMSFQSRAEIPCWNHALAQHSNLVK